MSTNESSAVLLRMEGLGLSNLSVYPAFLFGTLTYLFIMFCNLLVVTAIVLCKSLHKPMFILLVNLPISDMLGATAFFPQLVVSIVMQNRLISLPACVTQAFLVHVYGTGNLLVLSAMAYDRYVAICSPLKYNVIMTPQNTLRIIVSVWVLNLLLIVTLIALLARIKLCKTNIVDLFCNNPALLKLACEDTSVNNYYGIWTIVLFQGGALLIIIYTYAQILRTCIINNQSDARQKAIQTCGSHLVVYLFLEINTLITMVAHRINFISPFLRKSLGVSVMIFPPLLNPIIYGLRTKQLKQGIQMFLKRNVEMSKV